MSTPDPQSSSSPGSGGAGHRRRWTDRLLYVLVPLALGVVFVAILAGEETREALDLQIYCPSQVRAGDVVPVRAVLFEGVGSVHGPRPASGDVTIRLTEGREEVARAELRPSHALGFEGEIRVPEGAEGSHWIRAVAALDGDHQAGAVASLSVEPNPEPIARRGRLLRPLQQYAAYAIEARPGQSAPSTLDLRVVGGACVPEVHCELILWSDDPAVELTIAETSSVSLVAGPPVGPDVALSVATVVTHGSEAVAELVARRDGVEVAQRSVRLPIVQASLALRLSDVLPLAPARPDLSFEGAEPGRGIIVDLFRDGRWQRSVSVSADAAADGPVTWPFEPLEPGLYRVQARTDAFGADVAAGRMILVRSSDMDARDVARTIGEWVRDQDYEEPFLATPPSPDADPELVASFLMALPELDVVPQPYAHSGRLQSVVGLSERRESLRWLGALAFLLSGLVVGAVLLRRGLSAASQARRILAAAGDDEASSGRRRLRMTLTVVSLVATVALLFAAAAAIVLVRSAF